MPSRIQKMKATFFKPNKSDSPNAAIKSRFQSAHHWRDIGDPGHPICGQVKINHGSRIVVPWDRGFGLRPNEPVQATAAAPLVFNSPGDGLLPGFVIAQSPAAVPDLIRRKPCNESQNFLQGA